jgi:hypothetical protein
MLSRSDFKSAQVKSPMKSCPTCNRTFEDTFTFCLVDGSILSAPFDPHATLITPEPRQTEPPTEVFKLEETRQEIPPTVASPQPQQKLEELVSTIAAPAPKVELPSHSPLPAQASHKSSRSPLVMVGVGALLIIGLIFFIAVNRTGSKTENPIKVNAAMTPTPLPTVATSPNNNQTSIAASTPNPTPSPTPVVSLEGTTWHLKSTINSHDYEDETLEFKQNGRIINHIDTMEDGNWRYNNRGTWARQGDKVYLDFPTNPYYEHYKYEGTIQGEEMSGIIDFLGREANGTFTARIIK